MTMLFNDHDSDNRWLIPMTQLDDGDGITLGTILPNVTGNWMSPHYLISTGDNVHDPRSSNNP